MIHIDFFLAYREVVPRSEKKWSNIRKLLHLFSYWCFPFLSPRKKEVILCWKQPDFSEWQMKLVCHSRGQSWRSEQKLRLLWHIFMSWIISLWLTKLTLARKGMKVKGQEISSWFWGGGEGKKRLIVRPSKHEYNIIKNKYLAKWQSPRLSPQRGR